MLRGREMRVARDQDSWHLPRRLVGSHPSWSEPAGVPSGALVWEPGWRPRRFLRLGNVLAKLPADNLGESPPRTPARGSVFFYPQFMNIAHTRLPGLDEDRVLAVVGP